MVIPINSLNSVSVWDTVSLLVATYNAYLQVLVMTTVSSSTYSLHGCEDTVCNVPVIIMHSHCVYRLVIKVGSGTSRLLRSNLECRALRDVL